MDDGSRATLRGGEVTTAINLEPFPPTGERRQISSPTDLAHHAVWSPDAGTLFFIPGAQPLVGVSVTHKPTLAVGEPHVWPGKLPNNTAFGAPRNFDIFPDGKRFIAPRFQNGQASLTGSPGAAGGSGGELAGRVPRAAHHQLKPPNEAHSGSLIRRSRCSAHGGRVGARPGSRHVDSAPMQLSELSIVARAAAIFNIVPNRHPRSARTLFVQVRVERDRLHFKVASEPPRVLGHVFPVVDRDTADPSSPL